MLSLEISDNQEIRKDLEEHIDKLLEMAIDSKTEKNFKFFKLKLQGRSVNIEFSSTGQNNCNDNDELGEEGENREIQNLSDDENDEDKSDAESNKENTNENANAQEIRNENLIERDENVAISNRTETDENENAGEISLQQTATTNPNINNENLRKRLFSSISSSGEGDLSPSKLQYNGSTTELDSPRVCTVEAQVHNEPVTRNKDNALVKENVQKPVRQQVSLIYILIEK